MSTRDPRPDLARGVIYSEEDVTSPIEGRADTACYDLALYYDADEGDKGVLVVRIKLQFIFESGSTVTRRVRLRSRDSRETGDMEVPNVPITDDAVREGFIRQFRDACLDVWDNKFRFTSATGTMRDVGVKFRLVTTDDTCWDEHWEINVANIDAEHGDEDMVRLHGPDPSDPDRSITYVYALSSTAFADGSGTFDIGDLDSVRRTTTESQRALLHEFGHMLSFYDEYQNDPCVRHWFSDDPSVMRNGETVRPRHYAPFADWLTRRFNDDGHADVHFRVDGSTDMSNAFLAPDP